MVNNRVGPPVRGNDFYGREAFVDLVWDKLEGGHILLAAPRRFGKTSVMYRLIDAPRQNYKIIHADLEHLTEPAAFITELIVQLSADTKFTKLTQKLSYFPKALWQGARNTLEEVEMFNFKLKLKEQLRPQWQENGTELFNQVGASQQPVLFLLDEFPMMIDRMARSTTQREEAKTLLRWLRALRVAPQIHNVRFLIAGSIGIDYVLNELGEIKSINDFEQLRLEPFSPKVAAGFLDELAQGSAITLSQPSRRKILELIGTPVPYFIQILFSEVAKAQKQEGEAITPKRIEAIYHNKVLGVDCKTYFEYYYGRLRDYYQPQEEKAVKRLLREMATVGALTRDAAYQLYKLEKGERTDIEEFNYLMTNLENDFYIKFNAPHRQYEFSCKLLRDWWLRHYAMSAGL